MQRILFNLTIIIFIIIFSSLNVIIILIEKVKYKYFAYNPQKPKNITNPLIHGFAFGYNWGAIEMFVISLRKSSYFGKLVIGVSDYLYKKFHYKFIKYNITPIIIENKWPFYSLKNTFYYINYSFLKECSIRKRKYEFKWHTYRFSVLYCWMLLYGKDYSYIFNLDVRDVVFQGNPFLWNFEEGMYVVDETKDITIENEMCNYKWIKPYRHFVKYKYVVKRMLLNCGVIFGTYNYFFKFIQQFRNFLNDYYVDTAEQAGFNYAFYSGYFKNIKFYKNRNQYGVVLTCLIDRKQIVQLNIKNNSIYNRDLTIPLIVHQYDRFKRLVNMYRSRYISSL